MSNNNMSPASKRQRVEVQTSSGNHPHLQTEPHDPQEGSSRTRNNPPVHQVGFPLPPPGEEATYRSWRRRWMELYGREDISPELVTALQQYSQSVLDLQKKEQQETKAENKMEEIYEERKVAVEDVRNDETKLQKVRDDLQKAREAYSRANENRDNMDQQTAERHIQNTQRRLQYAEKQYLGADEAVQRSQVRLNNAEELLKRAKNSLDTARSRTQKCQDEVDVARLEVERILGLVYGVIPPVTPDAQSHLSDADNLVSLDQPFDSSPNTQVGKKDILSKPRHRHRLKHALSKVWRTAPRNSPYKVRKWKNPVPGHPQIQT